MGEAKSLPPIAFLMIGQYPIAPVFGLTMLVRYG